jgi:uncharacterized membrane protein
MKKSTMYMGFLLLIAVDTFVQIAFKFAGENTAPVTFDLTGGGVAFLTYMTLIRYAPIGPAFAASHLDIVTITFFSVLFLGDTLTLLQVLGCSAIVLGVLVLAYAEAGS